MSAENITRKDMMQFTDMPYRLSGKIHTFRAEHGHPYTYMELDRKNQRVARGELEHINNIIAGSRRHIPSLPQHVSIQTDKIIFSQVSPYHGYTKLICTPYTPTGKIAKHPLELSFMTDLDECNTYTAHGELYYGTNGKILKAEVYLWYRLTPAASPDGWFFSLRTINGELAVKEVKASLTPDQYGLPQTIYKI